MSKQGKAMYDELSTIRITLAAYIANLKERAMESSIRFENFMVEQNTVRPGWNDQNTLKYRVRLERNTLMLEWYQRVWVRAGNGKRETRHVYIRKRNKHKRGGDEVYGYDMNDLFKFSPEWSRDMVVEVEAEAATFRRQAHYCASMLVILGRLERYLVAIDDHHTSAEVLA